MSSRAGVSKLEEDIKFGGQTFQALQVKFGKSDIEIEPFCKRSLIDHSMPPKEQMELTKTWVVFVRDICPVFHNSVQFSEP